MTQDAFLAEKELASWWNSIVQDSRFDKVLVYARASLSETNPGHDQLEGVNNFVATLKEMPIPATSSVVFPPSGLIHGGEKLPVRPEQPNAKPKRKK